MKREWVIAGMAALLCHALLLFGFRLETAAVPLPMADTAVDVDLVAAAPAPVPAPAAPEAPPPPPPETPPPVPPPAPVPEPVPASETTPVPETKPPPREPAAHHEPAKAAHPPSTAPKAAAVAGVPGVRGGASNPVRPRFNPKPPYPPEARQLGQQGRVLLEVQVGADGRATSVSVKHSSGFPVLDSAAAEGVRRWTFEPARVAGLPVASRADVPVSFSLAQ